MEMYKHALNTIIRSVGCSYTHFRGETVLIGTSTQTTSNSIQ